MRVEHLLGKSVICEKRSYYASNETQVSCCHLVGFPLVLHDAIISNDPYKHLI